MIERTTLRQVAAARGRRDKLPIGKEWVRANYDATRLLIQWWLYTDTQYVGSHEWLTLYRWVREHDDEALDSAYDPPLARSMRFIRVSRFVPTIEVEYYRTINYNVLKAKCFIISVVFTILVLNWSL